MLIVQHIKTQWTKASRGGAAAARRNAVPVSFRLPPALHRQDALHTIEIAEWEDFQYRETWKFLSYGGHLQVGPVLIHAGLETIKVQFVWSWNECGAPERESHKAFELRPGEWGRLICNGRFGSTYSMGQEWLYHKSVFNVLFGDSVEPDVFVITSPNAECSRLATLR
jgi:hypothetical protein